MLESYVDIPVPILQHIFEGIDSTEELSTELSQSDQNSNFSQSSSPIYSSAGVNDISERLINDTHATLDIDSFLALPTSLACTKLGLKVDNLLPDYISKTNYNPDLFFSS